MPFDRLYKSIPARGVDVELVVDVGETMNQLLRGILAVDLGQGRIDVEILA